MVGSKVGGFTQEKQQMMLLPGFGCKTLVEGRSFLMNHGIFCSTIRSN